MTARLLDLFSGFGMFSLGLERSGMFRTVAFCEIEEYPRKVLAKHWPDVPIYRDVRALRGEQVGPVDAICGGFPCQDISLAGKGAGIGGERSGLWGDYRRLIRELRPRIVIVENVAALLVRGLDRVLGDLATLGYDAWWDCIPASAVGAPHRRDRVWIVAYANHAGRRGIEQGRGSLWGNPDAGRNGSGEQMADPGCETRRLKAGHALAPPSGGTILQQRDTRSERRGGSLADAEGFAIGTGLCEGGSGGIGGRRSGDGGGADAYADPDGFHGEPGRPRGIEWLGEGAQGISRRGGEGIVCHASGSGCEGNDGRGAGAFAEDRCAFDPDAFRNRLERLIQGWPAAGATDGPRDGCDPGWWAVEPDVGRVAYGASARVERLTGLGNGLIPTIPYLIGRAIGEAAV